MLEKIKAFFQEVSVELKKVSWPTRQQTLAATVVVITVSFIVAFFLGIVDLVLGRLVVVGPTRLAMQLSRQRTEVRLVRAVLQVAGDLRLLSLCSAAPHRVDPLAHSAGVTTVPPDVQILWASTRTRASDPPSPFLLTRFGPLKAYPILGQRFKFGWSLG